MLCRWVGIQFSGSGWVLADQDRHATSLVGAFKVNVGVAGEPDIRAFFDPAWALARCGMIMDARYRRMGIVPVMLVGGSAAVLA